jgi:small ligand-binding sensory domain FIST
LHASPSSSDRANSVPWNSLVSTHADLYEAIEEIVSNVEEAGVKDYDVAIFFVSSIYEASAFKYNAIYEAVCKRLPSIKFVVGSTTGGVVGSVMAPWGEPTEVEARASLGITFIKLDGDIDASTFSLSTEGVQKYIKSDTERLIPGGKKGAVTLLFATDNVKSSLTSFVNTLGDREEIEALGAVASSVTSLQVPKVFIAKAGQKELDRVTSGVIGLTLSGSIRVQTVLARSVTPVGPVFSVSEANGRDIMQLKVPSVVSNVLQYVSCGVCIWIIYSLIDRGSL